eukprot:Tbor_TRINITY_DN6113_c1_g1::TRINITY_DN6113_c1_g1_i1::g.22736::m.22736
MFRRPLASIAKTPFARLYTDYHHMQYPVLNEIAIGVPLYFTCLYLFFFNSGQISFRSPNDPRYDLFRVWKRKLGTGYKWSTEWPAEPIESVYKNLPSKVQ